MLTVKVFILISFSLFTPVKELWSDEISRDTHAQYAIRFLSTGIKEQRKKRTTDSQQEWPSIQAITEEFAQVSPRYSRSRAVYRIAVARHDRHFHDLQQRLTLLQQNEGYCNAASKQAMADQPSSYLDWCNMWLSVLRCSVALEERRGDPGHEWKDYIKSNRTWGPA